MVKVLPIDNDGPAFRFSVSLDGTLCQYRFEWDARRRRWTVDVLSSDAKPIIVGRVLLPGRPLFLRESDPRLPPGELYVVDQSGDGKPPGRHELGRDRRVRLEYVPDEGGGNV